jgi:F-type H+-transporting ATPase subunit delta
MDVASSEAPAGGIEQIGQELDAFAGMVRQNPALGRVLTNPGVPMPRKLAAVTELTKLAGVSPIVSKLLALLAQGDRLVLLNDVAAVYGEMLLGRQNVVRAEVTTATPLSADKSAGIERGLAALTGKKILMVTRVDEKIVGGVVARVGSTVYDASIATQLKKIRQRLTT